MQVNCPLPWAQSTLHLKTVGERQVTGHNAGGGGLGSIYRNTLGTASCGLPRGDLLKSCSFHLGPSSRHVSWDVRPEIPICQRPALFLHSIFSICGPFFEVKRGWSLWTLCFTYPATSLCLQTTFHSTVGYLLGPCNYPPYLQF